MEKEIRIFLSDGVAHGSMHGEVLADDTWLYLKSGKLEVTDRNEMLVTLVIATTHCDITYDAEFEIGADDHNR